jgi:hypothetical protein
LSEWLGLVPPLPPVSLHVPPFPLVSHPVAPVSSLLPRRLAVELMGEEEESGKVVKFE